MDAITTPTATLGPTTTSPTQQASKPTDSISQQNDLENGFKDFRPIDPTKPQHGSPSLHQSNATKSSGILTKNSLQSYGSASKLHNTRRSSAAELEQKRSLSDTTLSSLINSWQEAKNKKRKNTSPKTSNKTKRQNTVDAKNKKELIYSNINLSNSFEALQSFHPDSETDISISSNTIKGPAAKNLNLIGQLIHSNANANNTLITDKNKRKAINENDAKTNKPPPIYIPDVLDIKPLIAILNDIVGEGFELKTIGRNQIRVLAHSIEKYGKITKTLIKEKVKFHTYQLKHERYFRTVLRIHHSVDQNDLKKELEELGHDVGNIFNVRHRVTKNPLSLFYIDLIPKNNNKEIYNIKTLQHTSINFEEPYKKKRTIPQCGRCQRYGHTRSYCYREHRCMKCAKDHPTEECTKTNETTATCALCAGTHPANYKGCQTYKEIRDRRFPALRNKQTTQTERVPDTENKPHPFAKQSQTSNNDKRPLYSEVVSDQGQNRMEQLLLKLIEGQNKLTDNITAMMNAITALVNCVQSQWRKP